MSPGAAMHSRPIARRCSPSSPAAGSSRPRSGYRPRPPRTKAQETRPQNGEDTMKQGVIGALLGAALAVSLASAGALAQTIELKVSHYLPPNHQMHKQLEAW